MKRAFFFLVFIGATLSTFADEMGGRFSTFVDALYWSAQECGNDNWAQVFKMDGTTENIDVVDVPFDWKGGVRVGASCSLCHDEWDSSLVYTWFRTLGTKQVSTDGTIASSFLGNFYANNADGSKFGPSYKSASIEWTVLMNMFDWELGRSCCVADCFSLRPFIGLKGGWIHQNIDSTWKNPSVSGFTTANEKVKNNFWGVGPSIGLNTTWKLLCPFCLFGDFSGALLWGHWTFADVYRNNAPTEIAVELKPITGAEAMVRGLAGIGWERNLCGERMHVSLRLGYEMQFWMDQLQYYSFNVGRLDNELTLQGGVCDLRIDF